MKEEIEFIFYRLLVEEEISGITKKMIQDKLSEDNTLKIT